MSTSSAQLGYVSGMLSKGYEEIPKDQSPFNFDRMHYPVYLSKPDTQKYAVVGSNGKFIEWDNDCEDVDVLRNRENVTEVEL